MKNFTDNQLIHIVGSHQIGGNMKLFIDAMRALKKRSVSYVEVVERYIEMT